MIVIAIICCAPLALLYWITTDLVSGHPVSHETWQRRMDAVHRGEDWDDEL